MSSPRFPIPQGTLDMLILQTLSLEPAALIPARRASRVNSTEALRFDWTILAGLTPIHRTSISIKRALPCAAIWCLSPAGMYAQLPGWSNRLLPVVASPDTRMTTAGTS